MAGEERGEGLQWGQLTANFKTGQMLLLKSERVGLMNPVSCIPLIMNRWLSEPVLAIIVGYLLFSLKKSVEQVPS